MRAASGIEAAVRSGIPGFPDRTCAVTDPKYASLVRQVTDGQGSSVQSVVWYYGDAINAAIAARAAAGWSRYPRAARGTTAAFTTPERSRCCPT